MWRYEQKLDVPLITNFHVHIEIICTKLPLTQRKNYSKIFIQVCYFGRIITVNFQNYILFYQKLLQKY